MERPVLSSRVNMVKSFAFCEFATVEICDGVFNKLNNAQMGTGNLRFGRPKAYEQLQAAGQIAAPGGTHLSRHPLLIQSGRLTACLPAC